MSHVGERCFRLSIRALMATVAISALVLAPLAWLVRRSEQQRLVALKAVLDADRARALGARARAEALRVAYLARVQAAGAALAAREAVSSDPARASRPRTTMGRGGSGRPSG